MPRFLVILAMCVVLAAVLLLLAAWLWRQRGRTSTVARKALIGATAAGVLGLGAVLEGTVELLWHERPNQPATVEDLRIIDRADALLEDEASWNRNDDKICNDDKAARKWSLYCAAETACIEVLGRYEHTRVALQEVRFAVEEAAPGTNFSGRMMDFNNQSSTRFADVKRVLKVARDRVEARLPAKP